MMLTTVEFCLMLAVLPSQVQLSEYGPHNKAFYQFGYQVDTLDTGDYHGHMEQQDGYVTTGEFKVRLPDGRLQVTSYQADDKGFRPRVSYEIDPLFVPPPEPEEIPYEVKRKPVRRPPPKTYDSNEHTYLPPQINYDPRKEHHTPIAPTYVTPRPNYDAPPQESYAPPQESYAPPQESYRPPQEAYHAPPPKNEYLPPREHYAPPSDINYLDYNPPIINYRPKSHEYDYNYISSEMYTPSIDRIDDPDRDDEEHVFPKTNTEGQKYYLVPMKGQTKPVLALLVKKKE